MITSETLSQLTNIVRASENNNICRLYRIKENLPFSDRLNNFITEFYNKNKGKFIFTDIDDFNPENLEQTFFLHKARYKKTGKIHIWTGASEKTIFGRPRLNWYFRAWHDLTHIENNLGYNLMNEFIVCELQKNAIPYSWTLEKQLIHIEIIGQALYNYKNSGQYVEDQRKFTLKYLEDPKQALKLPNYAN